VFASFTTPAAMRHGIISLPRGVANLAISPVDHPRATDS